MIVFICIISLIIFVIAILSMCYVEVDIEDVVVESHKNIEKILEIILREKGYKKKLEILNYIEFEIKVKLVFLNIVPIFRVKINNFKLKETLEKQIAKEMKKDKEKIDKDKRKAKKVSKGLLPKIILKRSDFNMELGTEDAAFTAIVSSIANIAISIALPYVADENKIQKISYEVKPIYLNKNVFFLQFSGIISLKLVHIMKVICQKEESIRNE